MTSAAGSASPRSISRFGAPAISSAASRAGTSTPIGFEMYMKLLEEAIRELKGEDLEDDARATVNLQVDLKIDDSYIPEMNQRLMIYRTVAAARSETELEASLAEIRDRYGAPPDSVLNLAEYGRIRVLADRLGVDTIDREGRLVVIKFRPHPKLDPARVLSRFVHEHPGATLVPPRPCVAGGGPAAALRNPGAAPKPPLGAAERRWGRKGRGAETELVDRPGHRGRGDGGLLQGRDPPKARGATRARRAACSPGWRSYYVPWVNIRY